MAPKTKGEGLTRSSGTIDLGEDLLGKGGGARSDGVDRATHTPGELLKNAEILFSEGLTEKAKKALRRVIWLDREKVSEAKELLKVIEAKELQEILTSSPQEQTIEEGADETLKRLDRDLGLKLFQSGEEVLFPNTTDLKKFLKEVDHQCSRLSTRNRIDLGTAFLTMGLGELACHQFEAVRASGLENDRPLLFLLVEALRSVQRFYEALQLCEDALKDRGLENEEKIHFFYLVARCYEDLEKIDQARHWYSEIAKIDPKYRDVHHRLRKLK